MLAAALVLLFLCSPFFPFFRSLAVMGVYDQMNKQTSLLKEEGIRLHIPGGWSTPQTDWYPFVMTFTADQAYESYTGEPDAKLTILYNFPAFSFKEGASRLYDTASPYYNSFYGAYLVRDHSNEDLAKSMVPVKTAANIARFDFFRLVLGDFGLQSSEEVFEFQVTEEETDVSFLGYEGWTRLKADLVVNGSAHQADHFVTSYLQYGEPGFPFAGEAFAPTAMKGLIYARYFPEWDVGIYFYVMGGEDICRQCEEELLSKSTLSQIE
jgi:hypothetical protein